MSVSPYNEGNLAIEGSAHGNLIAGRFGMEINDYYFRPIFLQAGDFSL